MYVGPKNQFFWRGRVQAPFFWRGWASIYVGSTKNPGTVQMICCTNRNQSKNSRGSFGCATYSSYQLVLYQMQIYRSRTYVLGRGPRTYTAGWCFAVLSASRAHRMLQAHRCCCCAFFMGLLQALHAARSLIGSKSYILVF